MRPRHCPSTGLRETVSGQVKGLTMPQFDITPKDIYYEALKRMARGDHRFNTIENGPEEKKILFIDANSGVSVEIQALAFHDVEGMGWDYFVNLLCESGNWEPLNAEDQKLLLDELISMNNQQGELPLK